MAQKADNSKLLNKVTGKEIQQKPTQYVESVLLRYKDQIGQALDRAIGWDRFMRVVVTKVATDAKLMSISKDNPASLVGALLEMAQTGLDISVPNEGFLVPYGSEIKFQTGYKGYAKMAMEAAREAGAPLTVLNSELICEHDVFKRRMGSNPDVIHECDSLDRGRVIGYVAVSRDQNGMINSLAMSLEEMRKHFNQYCKGRSNPKSPWSKPENFDAYGLKTVTRLLIYRYLPMGPKLARAMASDIEEETGKRPDFGDSAIEAEFSKEPNGSGLKGLPLKTADELAADELDREDFEREQAERGAE